MQIKFSSKSDLNNFIKDLINQKTHINSDSYLIIREKLKEILKKGDLPDSFWINLYYVMKDINLKEDDFLNKNIEVLENYYDNATIDEKLLINNIIFILELFNSKADIKKFIKRVMYLNIYQINQNNNFYIFLDFINTIKDQRLIINILKETFNDIKNNKLSNEIIQYFSINIITIIWNIPSMFVNKIWLELFDDFVELLNYFIQKEDIENQMKFHFITYHVYGNNIQTIKEWRVFNEKVEKPASKFYKKWANKHNLPLCKKRVSTKKKKIGILIDRLILNSPWMVTYSLLKALKEDNEFNKKYEIKIYSMCYAEKQVDDIRIINDIKNLGIEVLSSCEKFKEYGILYPHLQKALFLREKIIEDKIDYLISGFGYDIPNFLFSTRTAPKQILWSHGNCTTDIEGIDKRISHFAQECDEFEWEIFNVPMAKEFLVGSSEEKKQGELIKKSLLETFGKDTVILGTIGRLIKIDSEEYLKVISEIMKQNPNTIYLACGVGNKESIKEKLKKYDIDESRFIFTGQVNPHVFGWVIDIWPDSFPLRQGQSRVEFREKGGVIIGMERYYNNQVISLKRRISKEQSLIYPLTKDEKEYLKLANMIIKDKQYFNEVKKLYKLVNEYWANQTISIEKIIK